MSVFDPAVFDSALFDSDVPSPGVWTTRAKQVETWERRTQQVEAWSATTRDREAWLSPGFEGVLVVDADGRYVTDRIGRLVYAYG